MIAATNAHTASEPAASDKRDGIPERHAVELRRDQASGADRQRQAEHQPDHARA